jgi:hypothetical protein
VTVFSFHLAKTTIATTANALLRPHTARNVPGLHHAECLTVMTLGSAIVAPARVQLRSLAVFAAWQDEASLDAFCANTDLGRVLANGWEARLSLLRRWGSFGEFNAFSESDDRVDAAAPVVAVTIARLKLPEVPRFVRWGKPVEELVRDNPATTLALAAMRLPRTVCTFSVWRTQREMIEMVRGKGDAAGIERHAAAMKERERRDFHHEFTTLRFRVLAERGEWEGRRGIVPTSA